MSLAADPNELDLNTATTAGRYGEAGKARLFARCRELETQGIEFGNDIIARNESEVLEVRPRGYVHCA